MAQPDGNTLSFCDESVDAGESIEDAQLFLLLRADAPATGSVRYPLVDVDTVMLCRGPELACRLAAKHHLRVEVPDAWMSSKHAQLSRIQGKWIVEDLGSKNGSLVHGQRISRTSLEDGAILELGQSFFLFRDRTPSKRMLAISQASASLAPPRPQLVTFLAPLAESFDHLSKVAPTSVPVMILGESGTGKELAAHAVHELSGRTGNFVAVNCGAIPEHLVESELFGATKGAYSGATEDRIGLIRAADGGTLFLDEIGDLPEPSQVALLRVLQQKEVVPVGGTTPIPVDFRLVVATHRDLETAVERGEFREDLMARIAGLSVRLPPLRERREDLGILIATLLARMPKAAVTFTSKGARALLSYDFPQNIRELERAIELAVALAGGKPIEPGHLPEAIRDGREKSSDLEVPVEASADLEPEDQERKGELVKLLEKHAGNVAAVARDMGKARMQIHRWLRRYGINPSAFR